MSGGKEIRPASVRHGVRTPAIVLGREEVETKTVYNFIIRSWFTRTPTYSWCACVYLSRPAHRPRSCNRKAGL